MASRPPHIAKYEELIVSGTDPRYRRSREFFKQFPRNLFILADNIPDFRLPRNQLHNTNARGGIAQAMRPNRIGGTNQNPIYDVNVVGVPTVSHSQGESLTAAHFEEAFENIYEQLSSYDKVVIPMTPGGEPAFGGGVAAKLPPPLMQKLKQEFALLKQFTVTNNINLLPPRYRAAFLRGQFAAQPQNNPRNSNNQNNVSNSQMQFDEAQEENFDDALDEADDQEPEFLNEDEDLQDDEHQDAADRGPTEQFDEDVDDLSASMSNLDRDASALRGNYSENLEEAQDFSGELQTRQPESFMPGFNQASQNPTSLDIENVPDSVWNKMTGADGTPVNIQGDLQPYLNNLRINNQKLKADTSFKDKIKNKFSKSNIFTISNETGGKIKLERSPDKNVKLTAISTPQTSEQTALLLVATAKRMAALKFEARFTPPDTSDLDEAEAKKTLADAETKARAENKDVFRFKINKCVSAKDIAIILSGMGKGEPKLTAILSTDAEKQVRNAIANSKDNLSDSDKKILQQQLDEQSATAQSSFRR